ncbi:MAG: LssY C-terminal domain-containing protein [Pseudomonadota bacterium]
MPTKLQPDSVPLRGETCLMLRLFSVLLTLVMLAGCGTRPYQANDLSGSAFLQRLTVQERDGLVVSASVLTAEETMALTGIDLYGQDIQPVWLEVNNTSDSRARLVTWSVDRDYLSPIEVAYMNRKPYSKEGYADMERWFHTNGMPRVVPPGESRSGLVFTNLKRGTKGFNLVMIHRREAAQFTFFLPLPGFTPDFMNVDFASLYSDDEIIDGDLSSIRELVEKELGCCATSPDGALEGGPFNAILIGKGPTVRRAMLRGGWLETSADGNVAVVARQQTYQGRRPDAIFSRERGDGTERINLHLWMSPWRLEGEPLWMGQVYYSQAQGPLVEWMQDQPAIDSEITQFFAQESLIADIDSAQRYLYQNLWYSGSLAKMGRLRAMDPVPVDAPRKVFGETPYFTTGSRIVAFLSDEPRALDEVVYLNDPSRSITGGRPDAPFRGRQVLPPNERLQIKKSGPLTIATAVPSADEAEAVFEMDLYAKNIQPVWVQIENSGDDVLQLTPIGIDSAYFSPREAANRTRGDIGDDHADSFESRGHISLAVPPHSIQSGYIFSRVDEGTKSFNIDVLGQDQAHLMSFFVPVPGLNIDHYDLNPDELYDAGEIREVTLPELVAELESMPCCVRDAKGEEKGDPLNIALIGNPADLYYSFMRAGWDETETIYGASLWKTAVSAVAGGRYRYSPVSALYVFDRPQDAAFQRARSSIHERNHLRVWMTPLRFRGYPVWIGQISRDIGVRFTRKTITTHKIDPDVDETREFLVEDLAFTQGLKAFGYVGGVGDAAYDQPRGNLTGDPYFTDGRRVLMWLSSEPLGLDEVIWRDLSEHWTGVVGP